jgi:hypothetical protein
MVELSLLDKANILSFLDGGKSERQAAEHFKVSKGTINRIKRFQTDILSRTKIGGRSRASRKRIVKARYENIDEAVIVWFSKMRAKMQPVDGPMIRHIAEKFGGALGISDFKASKGWLTCFKQRHSISFKKLCGEKMSADSKSAEEFLGTFARI